MLLFALQQVNVALSSLYYSNSKYYSAATAEIETWHDYDWQGVAILADK